MTILLKLSNNKSELTSLEEVFQSKLNNYKVVNVEEFIEAYQKGSDENLIADFEWFVNKKCSEFFEDHKGGLKSKEDLEQYIFSDDDFVEYTLEEVDIDVADYDLRDFQYAAVERVLEHTKALLDHSYPDYCYEKEYAEKLGLE